MSQAEQSACCQSCCATPDMDTKSIERGFNLTDHWQPLTSFLLLAIGLILDFVVRLQFFTEGIRLSWYILAFIPVGYPVMKMAWTNLTSGDLFTEFFLMSIASVGAFYIGEYPEGVAVMLFYSIGEAFQQNAVERARNNIRTLLDVRPETAHLKTGDEFTTVHPKTVQTGEVIRVKPGERIPLDGKLLTDRAAFETSALTGESKPRHYNQGETVLSGMINLNRVIELEVSRSYDNSSIARILKLVQEASTRKAKTELFIRSFAKIYTPAVVLLATLLVLIPAFIVTPYVFEDWLYRGLVFLVISCPCALVISIPLGYFGGIGAASHNGILVKGSNYLDALRSVTTVVFDKTGTLTHGTYAVQEIESYDCDRDDLLSMLYAAESSSTHPVAMAITDYIDNPVKNISVDSQNEIPGLGIEAKVNGLSLLIGSRKLMEQNGVYINGAAGHAGDSSSKVYIAIDSTYKGFITISDQLKRDSADAIKQLKDLGVRQTVMLSGDKTTIARQIGKELNIDHVYGDLLPDQKSQKLQDLKVQFPGITAYAGDGINDAPVLALSDVGIAMGAMGSDVAVETADVVIQTDQPTKIATAIRISRVTRKIVWQNIFLAMGVKLLVLGMGALGMATLWEAVFADVGVALLAILNAVRVQKMDFS